MSCRPDYWFSSWDSPSAIFWYSKCLRCWLITPPSIPGFLWPIPPNSHVGVSSLLWPIHFWDNPSTVPFCKDHIWSRGNNSALCCPPQGMQDCLSPLRLLQQKYHKLGILWTTNIYFSVLEAGKSKIMGLADAVSDESPLPHWWPSSHCNLMWQKGWGISLGTLLWGH